MRLLVFGRRGQVATELARRLPVGAIARFVDRSEADLRNPKLCAQIVREADVDAVINAAAWTGVDAAEAAPAEATVINGDAPGMMARSCAERGLPFLHLSTDYVFDGLSERPFSPDHPAAPVNAYGRSKLAGENAIRRTGADHLILRTSWIVSAHGSNFVKTMLKLGTQHSHLRVVGDQIGAPTPAAAIADAILICARDMMAGKDGGTYHFAGIPEISWAGFARAIFAQASLDCCVEEISSAEYGAVALRPANSRLDCSAFVREFGVALPDWRVYLSSILNDFQAKSHD